MMVIIIKHKMLMIDEIDVVHQIKKSKSVDDDDNEIEENYPPKGKPTKHQQSKKVNKK